MNSLRGWGWIVGCVLVGMASTPSAWAADAEATEIPETPAQMVDEPLRAQILQAIDAESDPELKALMQKELSKLESGELSLQELDRGAPLVMGETSGGLPQTTDTLPLPGAGSLLGEPGQAPMQGGTNDLMLPTEARERLEKLFQEQGTGNPAQDGQVRQEAESILKEYGIDPRELGSGPELGEGGWRDANHDNLDDHSGSVLDGIGREGSEWDRGGFQYESHENEFPAAEGNERLSPEGREQSEHFFEQERSFEAPMREAPMREVPEFEASTGEAPEHYAPEPPAYEAPEAPQHETPQYEAPEQQEAPQHEAPEQQEIPQYETQQPDAPFEGPSSP